MRGNFDCDSQVEVGRMGVAFICGQMEVREIVWEENFDEVMMCCGQVRVSCHEVTVCCQTVLFCQH